MESSHQATSQKTNFLFALAIVFAFGAWGAYAYLFHEVRSLGRANAVLASQNESLGGEASEAQQLEQSLALDQSREPALASYFVDATDPSPLFETVEGYGASTGVVVSVQAVDVKREPDRLEVTFGGQGTFAGLYRFVTLVEAAPYDFSFTNAKISLVPAVSTDQKGKTAAKPGPAQWTATMTMSISTVTNAASVPKQ